MHGGTPTSEVKLQLVLETLKKSKIICCFMHSSVGKYGLGFSFGELFLFFLKYFSLFSGLGGFSFHFPCFSIRFP